MASTPEEYAHQEWLGYVQPVGLLVSVPALLEAQCYVNKNIHTEHAQFLSSLTGIESEDISSSAKLELDTNDEVEIADLQYFMQSVFDWDSDDLKAIPASGALPPEMSDLEVVLPHYNESLRPTYAVPELKPKEGENPWTLLVQEVNARQLLDETSDEDTARNWSASPQAKFERLLRETEIPIGLLTNRKQIRLIYAPRGETSGYITFNVEDMRLVAGRSIFAALHMLLSADRLFTLGENERLPAILENSRKYQNTVSTELAGQVLSALYSVMRGLQAANEATKGELLKEVLKNEPNHVYSGLLTVMMRLVFILYAEDRDLISDDPVYTNHYSVTGLFNRLREDHGRFPDTMGQRYGAWAQLITLFRLIHDGGRYKNLRLQRRRGYLFDPDRYPFLEGRQRNSEDKAYKNEQSASGIPRISDQVVFDLLQALLVLKGERLSYRSLDVEQIGSVYETVMGFNLEVTQGRSIAIKPAKSNGAPAVVNLEELHQIEGAKRSKWLKDNADQKLGAADAKLLKAAATHEELMEALDKKIARDITPGVVPAGHIVLQPSDERRRSGSHYTPRSLTEPIVRTTLEPVLKQLWDKEAEPIALYQPSKQDKERYTPKEIELRVQGSQRRVEYSEIARKVGAPHPQQILDLKICDPAMGSGAFLVEACRQLGDELITAWYAHDLVPDDIPPDEDEVLYARRLVAQRCLYGVDKNVMAVGLAKLSLWLVTLAKDHAFTFLDHSLRHGDSLVGLTRKQIIGFHWDPKPEKKFGEELIQKLLDRATEARAKILNAREDVTHRNQEKRMAVADEALDVVRLLGDACVSCFFAESKKKAREEEVARVYELARLWLDDLRQGNEVDESYQSLKLITARLIDGALEHPVQAFHWEIEFPEVFSRENGGFDAFAGNPPFLGGSKISGVSGKPYLDWIMELNAESHGNSDLVAYFFRCCFDKVRKYGTSGLISSNTISEGDTRYTGLRYICEFGGNIIFARRRMKWPGEAAIVVSTIVFTLGDWPKLRILDGEEVSLITAFLFHAGGHSNPASLCANGQVCFKGVDINGMGFTFDDHDSKGNASPIRLMNQILSEAPECEPIVKSFIGGQEVNNDPEHKASRYVIDFGERDEQNVKKNFSQLYKIVYDNVRPVRLKNNREVYRRLWWQFAERRVDLQKAISGLDRILVTAETSPQHSFTFLQNKCVCAQSLRVFALNSWKDFATLQSGIHEVWARFFGSSMKDDLRYTPTDCFENFPFPPKSDDLDSIGNSYFQFRAKFMKTNDEGLTKTYNRFHSPEEVDEGILELRRLRGLMDAAVLRAYGWVDLAESVADSDFCQFLLDYEEEEGGPSTAKKKSKKKKPWRYRWPEDFRDEVLARLLELNEQRYKEEQMAGETTKTLKKNNTNSKQGTLL